MDVKKFMKFNNEKRVQMLGSVQTKYQMHISSPIETPWTPTFPFLRRLLPILLMKSQVIFIRRVGVATHAHNLLRVVGTKQKKKKIISYIEYKKTDLALYKLFSNMNTRIIIYILIGG